MTYKLFNSFRAGRAISSPSQRRGAFTLVELLVVIGIIGVLIGILLPALNGARRAARDVGCVANLHSLGQAFQIYANTYHNVWPAPAKPAAIPLPEYWHKNYIYPILYGHVPTSGGEIMNNAYLGNTSFECPAARALLPSDDLIDVSYGMSARLNDDQSVTDADEDDATRNKFKHPNKIRHPTDTVVLCDSIGAWSGTLQGASPPGYPSQRVRLQQAAPRHNGKINLLYADGHAGPIKYDDIPKNKNVDDWWTFWTGSI